MVMGPSSSRFTPSCVAPPGVLAESNVSCGKAAPLDAHAPNAFMIASLATGVAWASVGSIVIVTAGEDQRSSAPDDVVLRPARPDTTLCTALTRACGCDIHAVAPAAAAHASAQPSTR